MEKDVLSYWERGYSPYRISVECKISIEEVYQVLKRLEEKGAINGYRS